MLAPGKVVERVLTKYVTETLYRTERVVETLTATRTVTKTETTTKTVTERPTIIVEARVEKGYVESARDYEISIKVDSPVELDGIHASYYSFSQQGDLVFERKGDSYYSSFLTNREIGEHVIHLEVEKDGVKAGEDLRIDIGLSEEEIDRVGRIL